MSCGDARSIVTCDQCRFRLECKSPDNDYVPPREIREDVEHECTFSPLLYQFDVSGHKTSNVYDSRDRLVGTLTYCTTCGKVKVRGERDEL